MSDAQATLFSGEAGGLRIGINQVEYTVTGTGAVVHIFGREPSGRAVHLQVTGFRPYFYAPADEVEGRPLPPQVTGVDEAVFTSIKGERLRRLYTVRPTDVRDIRDRYHHHEADIPFATRYMIDAGLTGGAEVPAETVDHTEVLPAEVDAPARLCFIDIECEDLRGFPDPARERIICITCWDSFDDEYTTLLLASAGTSPGFSDEWTAKNGCLWKGKSRHQVCTYETEEALMRAFAAYIREKDPDILSGWNFTDFDLPYITRRMEVLGLNPSDLSRLPGMTERTPVRGRAVFDLLTAYKKLQPSQKESYRLDAVAEDEIGERKVRYAGTITDLWLEDPERLVEYNTTDVELCVRINAKNSIVDFYRMISRYVGVPLDRTLNSSNVIDIYILRKARGRFVLPSKGNVAADEFEGATVFEPSLGVRENVVVLDLKSLYPMAMMTLNASPETKDPAGELRAPNGIRFRKSPDGLTRSILAELMEERDALKKRRNEYAFGSPEYTLLDLQQGVMKVIMNTYYGVSGYARFRLYDREIGAAVTSVGRAIITHTRDVIAGMGYHVLYGDTDSCMVALPKADLEETIRIAREIEGRLNESYSEFARTALNADRHFFSIKFEKVYERFFQAGKKKRYAGHLVWKEGLSVDKIDIVGFEMKRSDSPQLTREVQEHVIELILKGAGLAEMKAYLGEVIRTYRRGGYPLDEVGIPGGIGKALEEYGVQDAHIRGAIYSNANLGTDFKRGSKPKRIYIRSVKAKYPQTDVLAFEYADQVPPEFVVDWETMLEKTIKQPIERIIEALGWTWTDVDPSRTTLFDFG
ncbi:DNA polymerase B region [Methanofollis liminatans DSM 4140]|uniref:DNA polymerase n=1 Tax=Methanofollis liminatans DSM 4140 TaxID=28892 RepID=J0S908_9EURY|nr:DNA-directed DNA polymerase [Methanofollis liminatans]EJG07089.1 DNA polymerase B region [Methanofollis liminatans DSM 4140]